MIIPLSVTIGILITSMLAGLTFFIDNFDYKKHFTWKKFFLHTVITFVILYGFFSLLIYSLKAV